MQLSLLVSKIEATLPATVRASWRSIKIATGPGDSCLMQSMHVMIEEMSVQWRVCPPNILPVVKVACGYFWMVTSVHPDHPLSLYINPKQLLPDPPVLHSPLSFTSTHHLNS